MGSYYTCLFTLILKVLTIRGMAKIDSAILAGITALYMMPEIANAPACFGILSCNLRYLIILSVCELLLTMRYVAAKNDHDKLKCTIIPILPYYFICSILEFLFDINYYI